MQLHSAPRATMARRWSQIQQRGFPRAASRNSSFLALSTDTQEVVRNVTSQLQVPPSPPFLSSPLLRSPSPPLSPAVPFTRSSLVLSLIFPSICSLTDHVSPRPRGFRPGGEGGGGRGVGSSEESLKMFVIYLPSCKRKRGNLGSEKNNAKQSDNQITVTITE